MMAESTIEKEDVKPLKVSKNWMVAFIMFGMYASFGMSWMGIVPLFQEIEKALSIGHSQGSWLISVISLVKSIFPIVAGIMAAKLGLKKSLRISGVLILTGAVIPWLPSYPAWIAGRFMFGMGGAMWVTLMGAVTMQVFSAKQRPLINSINGVAVNVGVILALWFTLPLNQILGWQNTLSLYSILSGVFFLLLWFFFNIENSENTSKTKSSVSYTYTLKLPVTWLISLAFTGPLALYLVFNTWLPIYYQEVFNISKPQTMQLMSWMNLWGVPAAIGTGVLLQYFKKCKVFIAIAALLLPVVSFAALNTSNSSAIAVLLPLAGVGMFLGVSPLITLLQNQKNMNPTLIGMILGTMFSVTYILSSLAPGLVGYGYDLHMNLGTLLSLCCVLAFSPAIALFLPENDK